MLDNREDDIRRRKRLLECSGGRHHLDLKPEDVDWFLTDSGKKVDHEHGWAPSARWISLLPQRRKYTLLPDHATLVLVEIQIQRHLSNHPFGLILKKDVTSNSR